MYPDIIVVLMYRGSDVLSTRADNQNTLTRQSANMNNAPRDPLYGIITYWTFAPVSRFTLVKRVILKLQMNNRNYSSLPW